MVRVATLWQEGGKMPPLRYSTHQACGNTHLPARPTQTPPSPSLKPQACPPRSSRTAQPTWAEAQAAVHHLSAASCLEMLGNILKRVSRTSLSMQCTSRACGHLSFIKQMCHSAGSVTATLQFSWLLLYHSSQQLSNEYFRMHVSD